MWWLKPGTTEYSNPPISFDKITNEKLEREEKRNQNEQRSPIFVKFQNNHNLEPTLQPNFVVSDLKFDPAAHFLFCRVFLWDILYTSAKNGKAFQIRTRFLKTKRESIIITIVVFTLKIKLNEQIGYAKILCCVWNKSVNVAHVEVQVSFTLFVKFPVCVTHISKAHMFVTTRNVWISPQYFCCEAW